MKYLKALVLSLVLSVLFTQSKAQAVTLSKGIDHVKACVSAVKDAITANDGVTAQTKAKDLVTALNDVPLKYMTPAQSRVWSSTISQLQADSKHISEVTDVADQKAHLASLTANLQSTIESLKMK